MLEIFDLSLKRVAILENAYAIQENKKLNSLWYLSFSLPADDKKKEFCKTFWYVRFNDGELYRIMPRTKIINETGAYSYQCEHVLATLLDSIMFGYHIVGNLGVYTSESINYILSHQNVKNWVLGDCDFSRQFEYGWENENLLAALFSIATPFSDPYIWETNTNTYPWTLNLRKLEQGLPECYVTLKRNLLSYQVEDAPENICTRLYPLGYGEGVNQLGIKKINNGLPYIQSPQNIINKYGIIERVWIDRRYENEESLLAAGEKMLSELQEPLNQYTIGYQEIDEQNYEKLSIGKKLQIRCEQDIVNTIITELNITHDEITTSSVTVANKSVDIATTVADLADRQRIEMAYAQGATQLYAQSLQANCDQKSGASLNFYIPQEMRIINSVKLKIKTESFRAYSQATSIKESSIQTSESGGGSTQGSGGGGAGVTTSEYGGETTKNTGESGIDVTWVYPQTEVTNGHSHTYSRVNSHKHEVEIPSHTHQVEIPSHTHQVQIPSHSHNVVIPEHSHTITPGIYRFGSPKNFNIFVDNVNATSVSGSNIELDITAYLVDKESGQIARNSWHSIEVVPDDLAYVFIDMFVQGFVQSRGDATV